MELGIVVALACVVVLWALLRGGSDPSRSIVDLWRFREPEWPTGVQEDDDLHWSWRGRVEPADNSRSEDRVGPEIVDTPPGQLPRSASMRVELQRVTYEVRSADRARS
jgi:hypothetical protein